MKNRRCCFSWPRDFGSIRAQISYCDIDPPEIGIARVALAENWRPGVRVVFRQ
jgi:hypothetical protein